MRTTTTEQQETDYHAYHDSATKTKKVQENQTRQKTVENTEKSSGQRRKLVRRSGDRRSRGRRHEAGLSEVQAGCRREEPEHTTAEISQAAERDDAAQTKRVHLHTHVHRHTRAVVANLWHAYYCAFPLRPKMLR